jgi:hypothetical protein
LTNFYIDIKRQLEKAVNVIASEDKNKMEKINALQKAMLSEQDQFGKEVLYRMFNKPKKQTFFEKIYNFFMGEVKQYDEKKDFSNDTFANQLRTELRSAVNSYVSDWTQKRIISLNASVNTTLNNNVSIVFGKNKKELIADLDGRETCSPMTFIIDNNTVIQPHNIQPVITENKYDYSARFNSTIDAIVNNQVNKLRGEYNKLKIDSLADKLQSIDLTNEEANNIATMTRSTTKVNDIIDIIKGNPEIVFMITQIVNEGTPYFEQKYN